MNKLQDQAKMLDSQNKLRRYKKEFFLPKKCLYMDGNSLGLSSKRAEKSLFAVVKAWKTYGIDGWIQGEYPWFYFAEKLGAMTAPLLGAMPEEIIVTGSATVNLHQLIATFFKPAGKKTKILMDEFAFPTDVYAAKSQLALKGLDPDKDLIIVKSIDGITITEDDIIAQMTDNIALIILPVVFYKSGQLLNIQQLTKAAHERNILIGFDACHSIGIIPHALHDDGVDFAIWCNYKYVNGGPGAEGGLFIHKKHFGIHPGLAGWFASKKNVQFDMSHTLTPANESGALQMGTPHIFSMAPLMGALEMLNEVGIQTLRMASVEMTQYMMDIIDKKLDGLGFSIDTPRDAAIRGGHIALVHKEAASICKEMKVHGVVPDFRSPHIIRLAPSPLYTSYRDIYKVIDIINNIMIHETYKQFKNKREVVA